LRINTKAEVWPGGGIVVCSFTAVILCANEMLTTEFIFTFTLKMLYLNGNDDIISEYVGKYNGEGLQYTENGYFYSLYNDGFFFAMQFSS
jgi:hypothetical protein